MACPAKGGGSEDGLLLSGRKGTTLATARAPHARLTKLLLPSAHCPKGSRVRARLIGRGYHLDAPRSPLSTADQRRSKAGLRIA